MAADDGLTIGEVARRTGMSVHALRFYEREQLFVNPVRRDAGGRRVYAEADVLWLKICANLRASGMPLAEIRRYAKLVLAGEGNERERLAVLHAHRERVAAELEACHASLELIDSKVEIYERRLREGSAADLWSGSARELEALEQT